MPNIDMGKAADGAEVVNENIGARQRITNMENEIERICYTLFSETEENRFDPEVVADEIYEYLRHYDRLLYAVISNMIFEKASENDFGRLQTNMDTLLDYVWSESYQKKIADCDMDEKRKHLLEKTQKVVLKMRDHIDLARRQFSTLKGSDEDFARRFESNMNDFKDTVTKDMSSQLITLVGIFTALAFIVFGEMSSLSVVFTNIATVSITRLAMIGTLWALFLINTIFIFMFCIQKFTNIDIRSNKDADSNIFQQYPIVWWSNFVMLFILLVGAWLHICLYKGFSVMINAEVLGGIVVIIVAFGATGYVLLKLCTGKKTKET